MGIYRRGSTYWARWYANGAKQRRSLETRSRAEAERLFAELTEGGSASTTAGLTVADILRKWLAFQASRRKPRSQHAYKIAARRFTMMWGSKRPAELTRTTIEEAQESLLAIGRSPRTINHQLGLVIFALRWAHERDLINTPPPKWKRLDVKGRSPRKYLTTTEMGRLFAMLDDARFTRLRPVVMLAAYAGLRMGEIIALRWQDVDLDDAWIHIRPRRDWTPKTAASARSIPITEDLAKYLGGLAICDRWVAPRVRGEQWDRRHLGVNVRRLFKAAGVDSSEGPHTLHRLRGTFATEVLKSSGDLRSLQAMLGHANLSVTSVYLSEVDEHKRSAVRGLRFGAKL